MKVNERDELLVRLDEKTNNIYALNEKQERHLSEINGHLADHSKRLADTEGEIRRVEQKVDERTESHISKMSRKVKFGWVSGAIVLIATLVLTIGPLAGWW